MIRTENLTKRYDGTLALEGLTLEVHKGELLVLLGPNGAGKTTTLRLLLGLISPTSGRVWIAEEPMTPESHALRRQIGYLPETPGFWERLPAWKNLEIYARLYGVPAPRFRAMELLEQFGLADRAPDPVATFSKGMRQRLALARALIHDPPILLLDEPTAGLDPEAALDVRELLRTLKGHGRTILLCTHDLEEAERLGDRVAILRTHLLALDTPDRLRAQRFGVMVAVEIDGEPESYLSRIQGQPGVIQAAIRNGRLEIQVTDLRTVTPHLVRRLVEAGAPILSVMPVKASLEELYLQIIREGRGSTASG
ncbi:MAG: ABC transporter ATP-binding protein [Thermoflexus sp.]|uniref:ABC transporter ATP-binding protein n=1 Tax=Thermoflexus sp. TaxID=1969742 RepID=UPI0025F15DC5|nr:ABC transporter ATP-binding protein [Thermoflexus sp.]MCS6962432.1 ABC transporter ATP-binding protein [Thermoflexus sp.]MCS7351285.1 ABC transporter ATP-binding protein [Thermoflexus sp.]MDW8180739.1 ABC transporter ATP-binding protein [Anaerolineae bacterium]MDW8185869.1 ABC transporter ATP-binding protein [Anaerolineae bacterium]